MKSNRITFLASLGLLVSIVFSSCRTENSSITKSGLDGMQESNESPGHLSPAQIQQISAFYHDHIGQLYCESISSEYPSGPRVSFSIRNILTGVSANVRSNGVELFPQGVHVQLDPNVYFDKATGYAHIIFRSSDLTSSIKFEGSIDAIRDNPDWFSLDVKSGWVFPGVLTYARSTDGRVATAAHMQCKILPRN